MIFHIINPITSELRSIHDFNSDWDRLQILLAEYSAAYHTAIDAIDIDDMPESLFDFSDMAAPALRKCGFRYLKSGMLNKIKLTCWKIISRNRKDDGLTNSRILSDVMDEPICLGRAGIKLSYVSTDIAAVSVSTSDRNPITGKQTSIKIPVLLESAEQIQLVQSIIGKKHRIDGVSIKKDDAGLDTIIIRHSSNPRQRTIQLPEVVTTITLPDEMISGKSWTNADISILSAGVARGIKRQYHKMIGKSKQIDITVRVLIDTSNMKRVPAGLMALDKLFKFKPED